MKKERKENDFKITSIFTEKELAELNFTEEEIADIEAAEALGGMIDIMPESEKDMDAFFDKFEAIFTDNLEPSETYNKFIALAETDPTFQAQIVAMTLLLDTIEEEPVATTEKVTLDELNKEKEVQLSEERQAKIAKFDAILKSMSDK